MKSKTSIALSLVALCGFLFWWQKHQNNLHASRSPNAIETSDQTIAEQTNTEIAKNKSDVSEKSSLNAIAIAKNSHGLSSKKVRIDIHAVEESFIKQKLGSKEDFLSLQNKYTKKQDDDYLIPKGVRLRALIENNCATQKHDGSVTSLFFHAEAKKEVPSQVYIGSLNQDLSTYSLEQMAQTDPCVKLIEHRSAVRAYGFNDPNLNLQRQLPALHFAEAQPYFSSSNLGARNPVIVAVVDSGVDINHEDLRAAMTNVPCPVYTNGSTPPCSGNTQGISYDPAGASPFSVDLYGHGTHVSGLIAASANNGKGVSGVTGSSNVRLTAFKILDDNGEDFCNSTACSAEPLDSALWDIYYINKQCLANNQSLCIQVVNISAGSNSAMDTILNGSMSSLIAQGVLFVVAAGNSGHNLDSSPEYPAAYAGSYSGIISVASVDSDSLKLSSFSNYSTNSVLIAAPGNVGIYSTLPGNNYGEMAGTSMATPLVSGALAMFESVLLTNNATSVAAWSKSISCSNSTSGSCTVLNPISVQNLFLNATDTNMSILSSVQGGRMLNLQHMSLYLQNLIPVTPQSGGFNNGF